LNFRKKVLLTNALRVFVKESKIENFDNFLCRKNCFLIFQDMHKSQEKTYILNFLSNALKTLVNIFLRKNK